MNRKLRAFLIGAASVFDFSSIFDPEGYSERLREELESARGRRGRHSVSSRKKKDPWEAIGDDFRKVMRW